MQFLRHIILSLAILTLISHSAKTQDNQYIHTTTNEFDRKNIDPFLPINFNTEGIEYFFKNVFNDSKYGTEFLPNDFSHILQFLQHGVDTQQGPAFAQSVFRLFTNKLKSASYVNAYAFLDLLIPLTNILQNYFVDYKPKSIDSLKTTVNDVLYSSFLSQFDFFKRDPKTFFGNLSNEILNSLNRELTISEKEIRREQLRQAIVKFLEICSNKLIWSPEDSSNIWNSIKSISRRVTMMLKKNILKDIDQLDDLVWSLTHRLCFFIDLVGSDLPVSFYQNIRQDLIRKNTIISRLEEQEPLISSKSDHLIQSITTGEAKSRAQQIGIVV